MLANNFMHPQGGTEILVSNLEKYCGNKWQRYMNMVLTAPVGYLVPSDKPTVLWCHLNADNENIQGLHDPVIRNAFAHYIFVSHYQHRQFAHRFGIPDNKVTIIKNAIDPIEPKIKTQNEPVRLIYTSMPQRGLEVLLDAYEKIQRDDILLDVYSSLKIYGSIYEHQNIKQWQPLFDKASNMHGVTYHGYASNIEVRQAVQQAHMWTYPSIFEETSCLSAIEAGAAGCRLITTNFGALAETCAEYGEYVAYNGDRRALIEQFANNIVKCVNQHNDPGTHHMLRDQTVYFNEFYGWGRRIHQWNQFFTRMKYNMNNTIPTTRPLATIDLPTINLDLLAGSGETVNLLSSANNSVLVDTPTQTPVRKVLIGTPSYDGRLDVWYMNSLYETIISNKQYNYHIKPIWVSYDSLIQRARNDLIYYMIEGGYDDIIFIDGDIEWQADWFFKLLEYNVDVVGATYPKKDNIEQYVLKHVSSTPTYGSNGLLKVDGLGTGFLRMSRRACQYLWDTSMPYTHNGKDQKWIFDVGIQHGEIISEDINVCQKLISGKFDIWLDTSMTCNHIGVKKYTGNFKQWFDNHLIATSMSNPIFVPPVVTPVVAASTTGVSQGPQRRFRS